MTTAEQRACPIDDRTICEGGVGSCPAKTELLRLFASESDESQEYYGTLDGSAFEEEEDYQIIGDDFPRRPQDPSGPQGDGFKLRAQLFEYSLAGKQCSGETPEGDCPTRIKLSESKVRSTGLSALRKLIKWV